MKRDKPSSTPGSPVLGSVTKKLKTAASAGGDEASVDAPPTAAAGAGTPGGQDEEGWTKVRKRKDKKQKKVAQRQDNAPPKFMYSTSDIAKRREAVSIADVRDLVLHLSADAPPSSWVRVDNPRSLSKTVVLLLPGLLPEHLSLPPLPTSATSNPNLPLSVPASSDANADMPWLRKTFSHALPTRAPGDTWRMHSILSDFFTAPVTGDEKTRRLAERLASEKAASKDPAQYCLSLDAMIEHEYPVPSYVADVFQKPEGQGWVETPKQEEAPEAQTEEQKKAKARILAIDCEMCQTAAGNELARICVIDYRTRKVVYDTLVRPANAITDYLTRWSGIVPGQLDGVTTTLADVQQHLLTLLTPTSPFDPTPILLGHSLESDLKALRLCHPRVIDTAVAFHHPRGSPFKPGLAWLARKWLNRAIQNRGEGGHDPEEDARACVDLLHKKVENGQGYGEFKTDYESIFAKMARSGRGTRSLVVDHGNPAAMHGAKASSCSGVANDTEAVEQLLEGVGSHAFAFGRLSGVAEISGWITPKPSPDEPEPPKPPPATESDIRAALSALDGRLEQVWNALPVRAALVLFTGHADPRPMAALGTRKAAFEQAVRHGVSPEEIVAEMRWTAQDGRLLEEEVEKAKRGLLFLCVKS